jgi:hypothetical protein
MMKLSCKVYDFATVLQGTVLVIFAVLVKMTKRICTSVYSHVIIQL